VNYIVSARYQNRPDGAEGDVFAAAMGYKLGLFSWPWTAVGYVKGQYDLQYYNGSLDKVNVDAAGGVVAWAFVAIGEFCDNDTVQGYQVGGGDFIIDSFLAPLGSPYTSVGTNTVDTNGKRSYSSTVTSNLNIFQTKCSVYPEDTPFNGRTVSRYQFKCGLIIDYTLLWSNDSTKVNGCPDTQRKIGVFLNLYASAFVLDVSVANLNSGQSNTPDANKIEFFDKKMAYNWDNFYYGGPSVSAIDRGVKRVVTATYIKDDNSTTYQAAAVVKQILFSFASPKSDNDSVYDWDPTFTLNDRASAFVVKAILSLSLLSLLSFFI